MPGLIRPSGGLLYHWRARRYARLWEPFRQELARWLGEWTPPSHELILIGPSAGYTLPSEWLERFTNVIAYDQDLLASRLFAKNHPDVRIHFHRKNLFWQAGSLSADPMRGVLARHPGSPILFTNVLGQVLLEGRATESQWASYLRELRALLHHRPWASYHDRFTHEHNEVIDHLTGGDWVDGLEVRALRWQLTPKSLHEIEAVRDNPPPRQRPTKYRH
jgi:hypothetical protein